jgi:hypothetical protein
MGTWSGRLRCHPEPNLIRGTDNSLMADQPEELTATAARAGSTPGVARNVLAYGLILVIVVFAVILFVAR